MMNTPQNILLTGATGFIGGHLLDSLLEITNATIYCLVREKNTESALNKIIDNLKYYGHYKQNVLHRIIPVLGDLSKLRLGINKKEYEKLTYMIDYIYHIGTHMDHHSSYMMMKKTNVGAIKNIIIFSITSKLKKILYTSTLSVFSHNTSSDEDSILDNEEHSILSGYSGTKWVAEKILQKGIESGLPIYIFRLGLITGDKKLGKMPTTQWFPRLLKSCLLLGCYYDELNVSVTPIDYTIKAITTLSTALVERRIYHLTNPCTLSIGEFFDGQFVTKVSYYEWLKKAKFYLAEVGTLPSTSFIQQYFNESEENITLLQHGARNDIKCDKTLAILEQDYNIKFPDIEDYKKKYIASL